MKEQSTTPNLKGCPDCGDFTNSTHHVCMKPITFTPPDPLTRIADALERLVSILEQRGIR